MTWLAWRQFRVSALVVAGALAVFAALLAVTAARLADLYRADAPSFFDRLAADGPRTALFYGGVALAHAMPALLGAFWGAPLIARELEAGTHRLVWTQSITRTRWLTGKLGLTAVAAVGAGLIGLVLTWWCAPVDDAVAGGYSDRGLLSVPRLWPVLFGTRGVVPIGYAVLACAVGVTAGLVLRRTVAAMAVALVVVAAVQIAMPLVVQPHLLAPERATVTITRENITTLEASMPAGPGDSAGARILNLGVSVDKPGAWITANRTLDPSGRAVHGLPAWASDCAGPPGADPRAADAEACFARVAAAGYRQQVEYQPADRFWTLQWIQTAILLGLALLLAAFCFRWIRRVS